ncbi:MAG: helix-turn-helix domain-containing protein, partial [Alphaproteobacteria bacterium]|nr:helix-turn-helix domain-containing protein [Alphaproteobacteria bacterium]
YITITDLEGLWKAIGLCLVSGRKVLAPRELRFLREHMRMTQAELAAKIRVSDQSVARWEKGTGRIPGPAELMIRVLFLASDIAQPEGERILDRINALLDDIVAHDEELPSRVVFRHSDGKREWRKDACLECA